MLRWRLGVVACAVALGACSSMPSTAAVVDGVEVSGTRLAAMSPDRDRAPHDLVRDLNLLILHEVLTTQAAVDFDLVASEEQIAEAFSDRVRGREDDVEEWLANRGSTRERVLLEAELDVIREALEDAMVESDEYGFDFDAAYRSFLGVNSRVCLRGLGITDPELTATIESGVETGETIASLSADHPGSTEIIDLGCNIPIEHGTLLAPVALDGEIGVAYIRETTDGTKYVVEVTERDAPAAEDVFEEVMQIGRERQGPLLFDAWVIDVLKSAEVTVDTSIGVWGTTTEGDVPTVTVEP